MDHELPPLCGPPGRALWVGRHAEPRSVNGKRTCLVPLLSWPHSDKSCLLPPSQEPPGGPAAGLAVSFIRPQAHGPDSHDPGVVLDEEVPSPSAPTAASPSRALAPGPSVSAAHGGASMRGHVVTAGSPEGCHLGEHPKPGTSAHVRVAALKDPNGVTLPGDLHPIRGPETTPRPQATGSRALRAKGRTWWLFCSLGSCRIQPALDSGSQLHKAVYKCVIRNAKSSECACLLGGLAIWQGKKEKKTWAKNNKI